MARSSAQKHRGFVRSARSKQTGESDGLEATALGSRPAELSKLRQVRNIDDESGEEGRSPLRKSQKISHLHAPLRSSHRVSHNPISVEGPGSWKQHEEEARVVRDREANPPTKATESLSTEIEGSRFINPSVKADHGTQYAERDTRALPLDRMAAAEILLQLGRSDVDFTRNAYRTQNAKSIQHIQPNLPSRSTRPFHPTRASQGKSAGFNSLRDVVNQISFNGKAAHAEVRKLCSELHLAGDGFDEQEEAIRNIGVEAEQNEAEIAELKTKLAEEHQAAVLGWKLLWNQRRRIEELEARFKYVASVD